VHGKGQGAGSPLYGLFERVAGPRELLADLPVFCIVFNKSHLITAISVYTRDMDMTDGDYIPRSSFSEPFVQ
jgi:hypothetical protein